MPQLNALRKHDWKLSSAAADTSATSEASDGDLADDDDADEVTSKLEQHMKVDRDDKEQGPLHRTTDKEQGDLQKIVKQMEKPAKYCIEKLKCNLLETPNSKQKSPPSEDSVIAGLAELRQAIVAEIHRSHDSTARYDSGASRGLLEADVPSLWPTSNPTTQGGATSQGRPPARLDTTASSHA